MIRKTKAVLIYQCMSGEENGQGVLNGEHGVSVGKPCCAKAILVPVPGLFSYGNDAVRKPGE